LGFVAQGLRMLSIRRLKRGRRDLWEALGSPGYLERDSFGLKFPYHGWRLVYRQSGRLDRLILVLVFGSSLCFSVGIALLFLSAFR